MRGRAILQGVEQEAELELGFFWRDLQCVEHLLLDVGTVDTHRATAHFPAVEHHVVALGNAFLGRGDHPVLVTVLGRGKWVVGCGVALGFLVEFEHGKVHHPHRAPAFFKQAVLLAEIAVANLDAQRANGVVDDLGLVGTKKDQVAVLRAGACQHFSDGLVMDVLHDGALQAVTALGQFIDLDVGQALGTVDLDELGVGVNFATGQATRLTCATGHAQCYDAAILHGCRTGEDLEVDIGHHIGDFGEFQLHAQIGLV